MTVKITRAPYKVAFNTRLDPVVYEALVQASNKSTTMTAIVDAALRKYLKMEKMEKTK